MPPEELMALIGSVSTSEGKAGSASGSKASDTKDKAKEKAPDVPPAEEFEDEEHDKDLQVESKDPKKKRPARASAKKGKAAAKPPSENSLLVQGMESEEPKESESEMGTDKFTLMIPEEPSPFSEATSVTHRADWVALGRLIAGTGKRAAPMGPTMIASWKRGGEDRLMAFRTWLQNDKNAERCEQVLSREYIKEMEDAENLQWWSKEQADGSLEGITTLFPSTVEWPFAKSFWVKHNSVTTLSITN